MKLRLKKKNCAIFLAIVLFIILEIVNPLKIIAVNKLESLDYSKESSSLIIKYGLKSKVLDSKYSEFIDKNISSIDFIVDNYNIYKDLIYKEKANDIKLVNEMINKGYTTDEINCLIKTGDRESIKDFITREKPSDLMKYLNFDFAILANYDKYVEYKELNITTYEACVTYVNLNLEREDYVEYDDVDKFSYTMLVNRNRKLSSEFVPDDLITFPKEYCYGTCEQGNAEMINAFTEMASALYEENNLSIYVRSAYRSYQDQEETYNKYLKAYGQSYVDKNVALAGFSEHQTGLGVDIKAGSSDTFQGTEESSWLQKNAYKYGFILRFKSSTTNITKFQSEIWHYRYVGLEAAEYIYKNDITLEEYYARFLINEE